MPAGGSISLQCALRKSKFLKLPFSFIMSSSSISNASFSGIVKFTIVGGFNKISAYQEVYKNVHSELAW